MRFNASCILTIMRKYLWIIGILAAGEVWGQDNLTNIPDPDPAVEQASFVVTDGFEVNLFAAEPMIDPPIQMTWDERGRLWVATSTSYPQPLPGQEVNDKIFVLEDTDGDGAADKSTVFADSLLTPTGILFGHGGVYVANSTEILHLADTDGDDRADTKRVVLSGFGADDTHHLVHTFRWGPDGRFYMNQSVYIYSHIETPWGIERLRGGGIWRFDPASLKLEVFSRGLWNPWGYDVDRWGQSFATDGAGFQGIHFMFPDVAYAPAYGVDRVLEGLNPGDPKYSGLALISGRHFPESWAGHLITNDYRANRVKRFILTEDGSGFAAEPQEDLIWTDHYAFRPVDVRMGPDGALYLADWYNPIIQHGEVDFRDPRRDHHRGRIWRVTSRDRPTIDTPALQDAALDELLNAQQSPEMWTRRQAKRLLWEKGPAVVRPALDAWVQAIDRSAPESDHALLEALWTYQALKTPAPELLYDLLRADEHRIRSAAVRTLLDWHEDVPDVEDLLAEAIRDAHPQVRREALHALSRLEEPGAVVIALRALEHPVDDFLEYALWQAVRSLSPHWLPMYKTQPGFLGEDDRQVVFALKSVDDPLVVNELISRYTHDDLPQEYKEDVLDVVARNATGEQLAALLGVALQWQEEGKPVQEPLGILEKAARNHGTVPDVDAESLKLLIESGDPAPRSIALRLVGHLEAVALREDLQAIAKNEREEAPVRAAALEGIGVLGDSTSRSFLAEASEELTPFSVRLEAAALLPALDLSLAAAKAIKMWNAWPADGPDPWPLFQAFTSQEHGRTVLAEALKESPIPSRMAQIALDKLGSRGEGTQMLRDALISSGAVVATPKMDLDPGWYELQRLEHDVKAQGNPERGAHIYERPALQCVRCHVVNGEGGQLGPALTSIGVTAPTDYLIESLLNPEAAVKDGFALVRVVKQDGSVLTGLLAQETGSSLIVKDAAGVTTEIPRAQVRERSIIPGSLMPAGLMGQLDRDEFVDLVAYLSSLGKNRP